MPNKVFKKKKKKKKNFGGHAGSGVSLWCKPYLIIALGASAVMQRCDFGDWAFKIY